ncbi:MAG TPA: DUF302 domain-containing protein [Gammaproteobacteria bacterium]|nr:DUF302 domain-containing protein [Gammaproteobacteria bacterium]
MTRRAATLIGLLLAALVAGLAPARAEDLFMVRSRQPFPEAMSSLQQAIDNHGYVLSRVQRVDVGLTHFGFKTDKYRVVFFGKPKQVRALSHAHPMLIPYLPLKIAIFAEGRETLLVAANPDDFKRFFHDKALNSVFDGWAKDLRGILDQVRESAD